MILAEAPYSDEGRSGIDLARRPGLRQLLDDVVTLRGAFRAVLVYDVSRWGRFQDSDESAHYEFLCKSAGVKVVYCAESFADDNSVASSLLKSLRRTMAGEYLRELSTRVFAGQCRLARKGFKLGGSAGYGLRRLLLDSEGKPKAVLMVGERKYLVTERVTYIAGPASEVKIVRRIYSLFLDLDLNCSAIAKRLNALNVPRENSLLWTGSVVKRILSHPKYTGCVVFNQTSARLRSKIRRNPREEWVIQPNSFEPIISQSRFEQAQKKLKDRVFLRTGERLLLDLRSFVAKHGAATKKMLAQDPTMASPPTYEHRFGSFRRALELIKLEPPQGFSVIDARCRMKLRLQDEFAAALANARITSRRSWGLYSSDMHRPVLLDVARWFRLKDGHLRSEIRYSRRGGDGASCIAARLYPDQESVTDYLFIPRLPKAVQRLRLSEERIRTIGFITRTLPQAIELLLAENDQAVAEQSRFLWRETN